METVWDVTIIGGGLAGLSTAIQMRMNGFSVLVLEKDDYPRHKVCGEYISNESLPFLKRIGLQLNDPALPRINRLQITAPNGNSLNAKLLLGGFGISRYALDEALAQRAIELGVTLESRTKADNVVQQDNGFLIQAGKKTYQARAVCGSWGKRSNLDVKLERPFVQRKASKLDNFIGIKYHIRIDHPSNLIALHNFDGGYCGISRVEDDKCCLCYLTNASVLKANGNDIQQMEAAVLRRNPHLNRIFSAAEMLYEQPLAISQISFQQKETALDGMLLSGDTAGLITPLCGNGMSMAFHASVLATDALTAFLRRTITQEQMEQQYTRAWKKQFALRLQVGRLVQGNFGKPILTSMLVGALKALPFLHAPIIRRTHGKPF